MNELTHLHGTESTHDFAADLPAAPMAELAKSTTQPPGEGQCAEPSALPATEPRWLVLLKAAVASEGRGGLTKASEAMGISRVYVSRVLMKGENRIAKPSPKFIARVLAAFGQGRVDCPHLARDIAAPECSEFAALEWKTIRGSGPERVLHWRACQSCPNSLQQNPQPKPQANKTEVPHGPAA